MVDLSCTLLKIYSYVRKNKTQPIYVFVDVIENEIMIHIVILSIDRRRTFIYLNKTKNKNNN